MVAEKVRKNCIGKHGENKHEEPGPTTEETIIKPRSCSCETGTLRCNTVKFLSWCSIMHVILVRLIF